MNDVLTTARIIITEGVDESGEVLLNVETDDGVDYVRYLGLLEAAKLSWDEMEDTDE